MVGDYYQISDSCQIKGLNTIYEEIFGQTRDGLFVEVGAHDGVSWSNTSGLADIGWKGYYVEPLAEQCAKCTERHKHNDVEVINVAIGNRDGVQELYLNGNLTTANPLFTKIYQHTDWSKRRVTGQTRSVQVTTLDRLLATLNLTKQIDVLAIDVEGFEYEVLQGFNIARWMPKVIIIEVEDEHSSFVNRYDVLSEEQVRELSHRFRAIREYFRNAGYEIIYKDDINTIYLLR